MSLNIFAFNLFKHLASGEPGSNILCSPYIVSSAMSMLLLGADGDTRLELEKALSVNGSAEFHQEAASIQDALAGNSVVETLKIANKIFLGQSFPVNNTFKNELAKFYKASCALEDFKSKPETSRQNINRWVAEKTEEKIQELMPPNSISCDTRLVLANAVHFKGKWESQFDKAQTSTRQNFHTDKDKIVKVDMMRKMATYPFAVDAGQNMMMLEMSYQNSPISMVIILPTGDLAEIEKSLDASKFAALYKSLFRREVNVAVPKFKLEFEKDLCNAFHKMGAGAMLSSKANFRGISDSKDLFVTAIFHKAFIAVDEEGTEAAAATGVMIALCLPPPPAEFICNKPFLFFLYHKPTQAILFTGRMLNPSAQKCEGEASHL